MKRYFHTTKPFYYHDGYEVMIQVSEVESNFFCYAATVLSSNRNVLIFTQRMHKPTGRPFTR